MASPIIGALYFGFVSATTAPAAPADLRAAYVLPTPQCVVCGPANRSPMASVYNWSSDHAKVKYQELGDKRFWNETADRTASPRIGITGEQVQRLEHYAGA